MSSISSREAIVKRWWSSNRGDVARHITTLVGHIRQSTGSKARRADDLHHMRLYGNYDVAGDARKGVAGAVALVRGADGRMRYNLCASAVDTAASVIAQQRPRPMYLTTSGDFELQRKARLRTRALEGQLWDLKAYESGPQVFIDAAVLGTGAWYGCVHPVTGKPHIERVLPMELVVDHDDAIDGKPRTMYRVRTFARDVLMAAYPSKAKAIEEAKAPGTEELNDLFLTRDTTSDRVVVVEAWHLGSKKDRSDGRRVIACDGVALVDRPYTRRRLPFAECRWKARQVGYWGAGIVEAARDPQWRINKLIARTERQNDLGANHYLLIEGNSKVRTEALDNRPLVAVRYQGTPPVALPIPGAHPNLSQEIAEIREQFFSEQGISPMLAEGKKPAGLNSGTAQRAHDDIQSRRHVMMARNYENAFMDLVDLLVDLNDQAAEADPSYCVTALEQVGRAQSFRSVKWADVQVDDDDLRLRMFPTSALPTTPQGKMAAVQEWIAGGMVSRPFAISLLDFPDLDAATRVELANLDFAMWQCEELMEGRDVQPDEFADLEMCADIARRAYLQARIQGAPETTLQAMRDHVTACMEAAAPPPAPDAAVMAPQPQPGLPGQPGPGAPPPSLAMGGPMMQ